MAQQTTATAGSIKRATAVAPAEPLVSLRSAKPRSLWTDAWYRLTRNKMAVVGMVIVVFFWLVALLAPALAPYHFNSQNHSAVYRPPAWTSGDWRYILGTDGVGRDELSRLIWGARISMVVGLVPVSIHLLVGGLVGLIAGYRGGRTDNLLMRVVDIFYAFPGLLLIIIMSAAFRDTWLGRQMGGLLLMFTALAIVGWEGAARLVRGQVLSIKQKEYIEAARTIGASNFRIMVRHILPNILAPLLVSIAFGIPGAIFAEAGLSFIGLGIRPPTASWGNMIQDGFASIYSNPVLIVAPATCVGLVLLAFTFLGDGLRDALDPRMKQ
ncbi:MAG: ABC transporter permease [Chloroflexi bacterium]|nr:ABC transporter permease [Chloroflexota bacterium]